MAKPTSKKERATRRMPKRKPKHEIGAFVRVPLADGTFAYGRHLELPYLAFYDFRTSEPVSDLDVIETKPILFKTAARVDKQRWIPLGTRALSGDLLEPVVMFHQEIGDFRKCTIFDSAGNARAATPEECVGIERAGGWEPHGIEQRLLDNFEGRPNRTVEHNRARLEAPPRR